MIHRAALLFLLLLFISGCSRESEPEFPRQRAQAERYISYQAEGEWEKLCQMLSPGERKRVRSALRGDCAKRIEASPELARTLQDKARGAEITGIRREEKFFEIEVGPDLIWITPEGVSLRSPL